jgi:predicted RNase H-like HicB family nuclease
MVTKNIIKKIKTRVGIFDSIFISNYPQKGYTVEVPKLKGVVTFGDNLNEAQKNIREAIELHCQCLLENGLAEIKPIFGHKSIEKELAKV